MQNLHLLYNYYEMMKWFSLLNEKVAAVLDVDIFLSVGRYQYQSSSTGLVSANISAENTVIKLDTGTSKRVAACFFCFRPLTYHNVGIVFCWLCCLCHPASHWLSLCVFCSRMIWTHRATDSSALDGEWPFLQPIRCHWAPLLWSPPFREDESH